MTMLPGHDASAPLPAAADFYRLRREGIDRIADTSGELWTDYNTHDPGITILEAYAYATTELAYRAGFPVEDLLASVAGAGVDPADPYPDQAFYSARRILTVNPTTPADLRRLLVDVEAVRNAWVRCDACGCATSFFSWWEEGRLTLSHDPAQRARAETPVVRVTPRGLYRVLLELEADPDLGELGDRKTLLQRAIVDGDGRRRTLTAEVRFPEWGASQQQLRRRLRDAARIQQVTVSGPNRTTTGSTAVDAAELRRHWFDVLYVDFDVQLTDGTRIAIENASLRLFGDGAARTTADPAAIRAWLEDGGSDGVVERYRRKLRSTDAAMAAARTTLEAHRNLDEDWCCVGLIEIADVAVCADVEIEPGTDLERVGAEIWFELERYLAPPVDFTSLGELRARGVPSESIFNGPELDGGFLTDEVLTGTDLREQLRVSDILNQLMEIDGVRSIEGLQLTAYDSRGLPISGISDPDWSTGTPLFDDSRTSASWVMVLSQERRARLHQRLSRISFSSGGLPFTPRADEVEGTLAQLRGQASRPRLPDSELDLPIPMGARRDLQAYEPVQHSLPAAYGIGRAGLPTTASTERRAQALQLKGYLMVFEQLLRNAYAQLAHSPDLFSLDRAIDRTYFTALLDTAGIVDFDRVVDTAGLTADALAALAESPTEFERRRNAFLDHLLARFGESVTDNGLVLTDLDGQSRSGTDLIRDKLAFLRAVPRIEHDRAKAFDRRVAPCDPDNASGLRQRMNLLLGLPDWTIVYRASAAPGLTHSLTIDELGEPIVRLVLPPVLDAALAAFIAERWPGGAPSGWSIQGADGRLTLTLEVDGRTIDEELMRPTGLATADALGRAIVDLQRRVLTDAVVPTRLHPEASGSRWRIVMLDRDGNRVGTSDQHFFTRQGAVGFIALLGAWAAHQRSIVVEHLLLRPKFPGDALYPACSDADPGDGSCGCGSGCGSEDPYSFRLTYAMPGWTAPFSTDIQLRRYADRTIQEHAPSHLLVKTCWIGNDGTIPDPCDPVVDELARILREHGERHDEACDCASELFALYHAAFAAWSEQHPQRQSRASLESAIAIALAAVDLSAIDCAATTDADVRRAAELALAASFAELVLHGYQFERFEAAWCAWADADARMDWSAEQLDAVVSDLLAAGALAPVAPQALCTATDAVLQEFGTAFRAWMDAGLAAGIPLASFPVFDPPVPAACAAIVPAAAGQQIRDVLRERYVAYSEASFRLSLLVESLSELRNTYPRATLHDCDEGSDFNPVRLGQTALGSN